MISNAWKRVRRGSGDWHSTQNKVHMGATNGVSPDVHGNRYSC